MPQWHLPHQRLYQASTREDVARIYEVSVLIVAIAVLKQVKEMFEVFK